MDSEQSQNLLSILRQEERRLKREAQVIEIRMGKPTLLASVKRAEARGVRLAIKELTRKLRG